MKKTKVLAIVLCLVLVMSAFAACSNGSTGNNSSSGSSSDSTASNSSSTSSDAPEYYKVAYLGPLTGDSSQYGEIQKATMEMIIENTNEAGGINGVEIKCDYYDDKNTPTESTIVANKIIQDEEVIAVFGTFSSTCALAAGPIFQKAGIVFGAPSSSHADVTKIGDHVVRGTNMQEVQQSQFASWAYNTMGARKVGLIYLQNDTGVSVDELFTAAFEELGGEIVSSDAYVANQTKDFSPLVSKAISAGAELIHAFCTYADGASIVKQARTLDFNGPILMHGQTMTDEFIELVGDDYENCYFITSIDLTYPGEKFQAVCKEYLERTGKNFDSHALNMYDCFSKFLDSLEKCGPDPDAIAADMRNYDSYEGLIGNISCVDGNVEKPMVVVEIQDGAFVSSDKQIS